MEIDTKQAVLEQKVITLEKSHDETKKNIKGIYEAINSLAITTEKISITLQRIEKLERLNQSTEEKIIRLSEKIEALQAKLYKVVGAMAALVFVAESIARFYF